MLEEAQAAEPNGGIVKLSFGRLAPPRFCFFGLCRRVFVLVIRWNNRIVFRAACAAALLFFWFVPPRFCFGDSIVMTDFIRQPEKLDTGSEAGMTKAPGTQAEQRDNINRSRAAQ